ncbi:hypothetical protein, partial [Pseudomonas sp. PS02285]|uniref:hypothetical protein n=1 Tax=Pseudomonas sp. PS02285 TaxID=2991441 RepID=UPI00249A7183
EHKLNTTNSPATSFASTVTVCILRLIDTIKPDLTASAPGQIGCILDAGLYVYRNLGGEYI